MRTKRKMLFFRSPEKISWWARVDYASRAYDKEPGLRLPASASLPLASCWPRPQPRLPVSATGGGRLRCCSNPPARHVQKEHKTKSSAHIHALSFFGGRGWIARAAHLKKPLRGFFAAGTDSGGRCCSNPPATIPLICFYKTETPVPGSDTGVLGGAKQPKSEPLPSGASLAAISSKVMVFVPSL